MHDRLHCMCIGCNPACLHACAHETSVPCQAVRVAQQLRPQQTLHTCAQPPVTARLLLCERRRSCLTAVSPTARSRRARRRRRPSGACARASQRRSCGEVRGGSCERHALVCGSVTCRPLCESFAGLPTQCAARRSKAQLQPTHHADKHALCPISHLVRRCCVQVRPQHAHAAHVSGERAAPTTQ